LDHPSLPKGELVYAIGDVHGRSDLLAALLKAIEADAARNASHRKSFVFIGDYIDRGPDSRGVMDMLVSDLPPGFETHFLKGNHEDLLLTFVADPDSLPHWLANGAAPTLASYGIDVAQLVLSQASPEEWRAVLLAALPQEHRTFLETLKLSVSFGDYFFAHAGVRPGIPVDAQDPEDLVWIREEFLTSDQDFGKVVVHGHTPTALPEFRKNRIGIDTGAVFTNRLTALRLEGERQALVQVDD
jgi:serine/threonine protein phosphatase 1